MSQSDADKYFETVLSRSKVREYADKYARAAQMAARLVCASPGPFGIRVTKAGAKKVCRDAWHVTRNNVVRIYDELRRRGVPPESVRERLAFLGVQQADDQLLERVGLFDGIEELRDQYESAPQPSRPPVTLPDVHGLLLALRDTPP